MNDHRLVQDLHAAISRRDWGAVERAANRIRDDRGIKWPDAPLGTDSGPREPRGEIEIIPPNPIYDEIIIPRHDLSLSTHPSVCGAASFCESSLNPSSLNQPEPPHD